MASIVGDERAEHHHPGHPEEQDVVAGDQDAGRIELRQLGGVVGPAHAWRTATAPTRTRCPARRGPAPSPPAVSRPDRRRPFRRRARARSGCGGPTTADARCTSRACCRPRRTSAAPGWRVNHGVAVAHRVTGGLGQRLDLDPPLQRQPRLDRLHRCARSARRCAGRVASPRRCGPASASASRTLTRASKRSMPSNSVPVSAIRPLVSMIDGIGS